MKNAINWFEIPVKNYDRGKKFYSTILGVEISEMPHPQLKYGILPIDMKGGGVGGGIVQGEGYEPSNKGSLIYLNGGDDLSKVLSKVEKAGGKILLPKTSIGQNGFMAHFLDTEGNKYKYFSYCGLVRHKRISDGKGYGSAKIWGNRILKCVYKMAGHSALTGKSGLRRYYDSLRSKGINHDNAYNAVSRKIAAISLSV
ncbi:MAG: hypothetical protein A3D92_12170 [Bacteroidetes bacterium RIFCSPHIGHO2_02_FULL_44_7]|nr:MAG: hypothetical protein A3D92_12170 [Bacteroidetes bacterium RIFCSPHIGHO2_02_FULL_44_7]